MAILIYRPVVRGEDLSTVIGPRPFAASPLWRILSSEVRAEFSIRDR